MKIKINKKKLIAFVLMVSLMICLVSCHAMPIQAASLPSSPVTSGKLVDMCLTRSGKVVNSDIREDVLTQTRNVLNDTATSYWQWLKDNGLSNTTENFTAYLESDAYASLPFRLSKYPLELASFIEWLINGETLLDVLGTDINEVLVETDDSGNVSVPSETVNIINQCFENVKSGYTLGYIYIDVIASSEMNTGWFEDQASYVNTKAYVDGSENPTIFFGTSNNGPMYLEFIDNSKGLFPVLVKSGELYTMHLYNSEWIREERASYTWEWGKGQLSIKDQETFEENCIDLINQASETTRQWRLGRLSLTVNWNLGKWSTLWVYGKQSGQMKVFDSLQSVKEYCTGYTPYYVTNRQYSDSVDNSFNVSGEYIQNNGGTFSYEQIREQINNSSVTNDSSVSNIVNDYSQTIINNYNYSSGGSGDNGGDDTGDSGNSILDGLGSIISAITDIIGFLLGVVGDVLSLLTTALTTVFDLLKGFGSVFASFSGLLGELFTFIPSEFIELLTASMSVMVILAVWKKFTK